MRLCYRVTYLDDVVVVVLRRIAMNAVSLWRLIARTNLKKAGLPTKFVQDNQSFPGRCDPRAGLSMGSADGETMRVTRGTAFLVAVDIRKALPHWGNGRGWKCRQRTLKQGVGARRFRSRFLCLDRRGGSAIQNARQSTAVRQNPQSAGTIRVSD